MTRKCYFCNNDLNPHDLGVWKQVAGWVHGPKRDSMTLREDTGLYAHDSCVKKARAGQAVDQPGLLDEVEWQGGDPVKDLEELASMLEEDDDRN